MCFKEKGGHPPHKGVLFDQLAWLKIILSFYLFHLQTPRRTFPSHMIDANSLPHVQSYGWKIQCLQTGQQDQHSRSCPLRFGCLLVEPTVYRNTSHIIILVIDVWRWSQAPMAVLNPNLSCVWPGAEPGKFSWGHYVKEKLTGDHMLKIAKVL